MTKLPRKSVIESQVECIRNAFDSVDDEALGALHGGQPRYGLVPPPPPPKDDKAQPASGGESQIKIPPLPTGSNDLLSPTPPTTTTTTR